MEGGQVEKPKRLGLGFINAINKPFLIMGLGIEIFIGYVVALLLMAAVTQVGAGILFLVSFPFLRIIDKENKKGNPDFLGAYLKGQGPGKYIEDSQSILNYLGMHKNKGDGTQRTK